MTNSAKWTQLDRLFSGPTAEDLGLHTKDEDLEIIEHLKDLAEPIEEDYYLNPEESADEHNSR